MNEEQAKNLITRAGAQMNDQATTMAVAALATADEKHGAFGTTLATTYWRQQDKATAAAWQATLVTHSTEVRATFDTEAKAMVWLANRLGAIMWAHEYATRDYAEVVTTASNICCPKTL